MTTVVQYFGSEIDDEVAVLRQRRIFNLRLKSIWRLRAIIVVKLVEDVATV